MSQYQTTETDEGTVIVIATISQQELQNQKTQRKKAKLYLYTTVIIGLLLYIWADFFIGILVMIPIVAFFIYFKALPSVQNYTNPVVDTKNRRIKNFEEQWVEYSKDTELVLGRTFAKELIRPGTKSNNTYLYHMNWTITLRSAQKEIIVFSDTVTKNNNKYGLFYPGHYLLAVLAEEIAELATLPLIDETGVEPIRREIGRTDVSLIDQLTRSNTVSTFDGVVPAAVNKEFSISNHQGTYEIKDRDYHLHWFIVIFVVLLSATMVMIAYVVSLVIRADGIVLDSFIVPTIMDLLLLEVLVFLVNLMRTTISFSINSDMITYQEKGLLWINRQYSINLPELEYMLLFKAYEEFGLELVSDQVRLPLCGMFDENEIRQLHEIIQQLIISV